MTPITTLADCHHGFRSQRSCETQLVQFVHDIISNLDGDVNRGHKQTDLIIMDFAKAFDTGCYYTNWNIIMNWGQHVSEISSKATKTLGFFRRNLAFAPRSTTEVAYRTLVRP